MVAYAVHAGQVNAMLWSALQYIVKKYDEL